MIAIIIPWSAQLPGGVSVVVRLLSRQWGLDGMSHRIVIDDWLDPDEVRNAEEEHFQFGIVPESQNWVTLIKALFRSPGRLWACLQWIKNNNCEGFNFHYPTLSAFTIALLKRSGYFDGRLVLSFHGTDVRQPVGALQRWAWRFTFKHCDAITTCSGALRDRLFELMQAPAAKCHVVYNGVDLEVFRKARADDPSDPAGLLNLPTAPYLVSIGSYTRGKGHEYLVRAFAQLQSKHPSVHLVIAGAEGPEYPKLHTLTRELGMSDRIHLLKDLPQQSVALVMRKATLAVQPSLAESFGLAVIEAAASGIPVLVSGVGGHLEIVKAGHNGWIFEAAQVEDCAKAIDDALSHPIKAQQFAQRLMDEVKQRFTWPQHAQNLKTLVLSGPTAKTTR